MSFTSFSRIKILPWKHGMLKIVRTCIFRFQKQREAIEQNGSLWSSVNVKLWFRQRGCDNCDRNKIVKMDKKRGHTRTASNWSTASVVNKIKIIVHLFRTHKAIFLVSKCNLKWGKHIVQTALSRGQLFNFWNISVKKCNTQNYSFYSKYNLNCHQPTLLYKYCHLQGVPSKLSGVQMQIWPPNIRTKSMFSIPQQILF